MESPYFTLKEAAAYARTSTRTIQRRLENGDLTRYSLGHHPLILKSELDELLGQTSTLEAEVKP